MEHYSGSDLQPSLCDRHRSESRFIDMGPRPFTLECLSPWGRIPQYPDISMHTDLISDVLLNVRAAAASDSLTLCHWLEKAIVPRPGMRRACRLLAERIQA